MSESSTIRPVLMLVGLLVVVGVLRMDWSLGQVSGRITLDGKPLAGVTLIMQPPDFRPSQATTDAHGEYVMQFTSEKQGVRVGQVSVYVDPFSVRVPKVLSPVRRSPHPLGSEYLQRRHGQRTSPGDSAGQ